ncbi:MAG: glycosyl transferase [Desulfacinum sp.]|jgi:UDP-GlcNAc:undecaprenyl-phosphate GlcNAc-1-phosphate transferase|nr:glycosyl transferase [Desulfacinum sp.]
METALWWIRVAGLFITAIALSFWGTPWVGKWAERRKKVAHPRADRWHQKPTPLMGGVAIVASFTIVTLGVLGLGWLPVETAPKVVALLSCGGLIFALGFYDDLKTLPPQTKLIGQIIIASLLVFLGFKINWFVSKTANVFLSILWIVAITNAFNLLDNMDGLSAGIAFISALFLWIVEVMGGDAGHASPLILLLPAFMGAVLGFLWHNFHPASIFMGDCGSLFLGFVLAAVTTQNDLSRHGHLVPIIAMPLCVFCLPLVDMGFVSIMRTFFGRSIAQGGRDHTSHRLVAIGMSEKQAVLALYAFAVMGGVIALLGMIHPAAMIAGGVVFGVMSVYFLLHLGRVRVYPPGEKNLLEKNKALTFLWIQFTYKKRIFEVLLDVFLISFVYWLAYFLRYDQAGYESVFNLFLGSLPVILVCCLTSYFIWGIYREVWRYTSSSDLPIHVAAVLTGVVLSVTALVFLYEFRGFSRSVFVIFGAMLLLVLSGSRFAFRIVSEFLRRLPMKTGRPVLIYGVGDRGEVILRELLGNQKLQLSPVGFIDDDERRVNTRIFGYRILGTPKDLPILVSRYGIQEVLLAKESLPEAALACTEEMCRSLQIPLRRVEIQIQ